MIVGSTIRGWWPPVAALMLPLLGLVELAAHFACAGRSPPLHGEDGWSAIVEPVRALHQPEDLIVVAPRWAEPLARQQLGDELMPIVEVARPDVSRYGSALEISILAERDDSLAGWQEVERREHRPWVLRRLSNPHPSP